MQADLEELKVLQAGAQRQYCRDFLGNEIRRLEAEIHRRAAAATTSSQDTKDVKPAVPTRSRTKIDLYGWGQSDRFLNLYVSDKLKELKGGIPAENVTTTFTDRSVQLEIKDLNGRDYFFTISNLCEAIVPEESNHKVKSDSVVINLKKKVAKDWTYVTATEKALKNKKKEEDDLESKKNLKSDDPQVWFD